MNKVKLTGNLVKEVKFDNYNGRYYVQNKIAVVDNYKTDYEETYFMPIRVFNNDALLAFEDFTKGTLIEVEGKVVYKNYKDKQDNWKNFFEIVVFNAKKVEFDKKEDNKKGGFTPRKK